MRRLLGMVTLSPVMEQTLAAALLEAIERRGLLRHEAAEIVGTSEANLSRWINDDRVPGPQFNEGLCRLLETDRAHLAVLKDQTMQARHEFREGRRPQSSP